MRAHIFHALAVVSRTSLLERLDALGIPRPDMELLVGQRLWHANERHLLRRTLDSVMFASLDALGIQRFEFSAQWLASWIALMVHPTNQIVACAWYHGAQSADSLTNTPESIPISEGVTAAELHEHVIQATYVLEQSGKSDFPQRLQEAVEAGRKAVEEAENLGRPAEV